MPAIGDLRRLWQRLGGGERITAAAIARDNLDLRLTRQPCLHRRRLPVGQKADGSTPFEIANDCAVTLVALPRPIVNPDYDRRQDRRTAAPADDP